MRHLTWLFAVVCTACGGKSPEGDCPRGQLRDAAGQCAVVCASDLDCADCQECTGGLCRAEESCSACDLCSDDEICHQESCLPACNSADRACADGFECVRVDGIEYCTAVTGMNVVGARWDLAVQTSRGGEFVVRGALQPTGGLMRGGGFVITGH